MRTMCRDAPTCPVGRARYACCSRRVHARDGALETRRHWHDALEAVALGPVQQHQGRERATGGARDGAGGGHAGAGRRVATVRVLRGAGDNGYALVRRTCSRRSTLSACGVAACRPAPCPAGASGWWAMSDTITQRARYLRGARRCVRRARQALHDYALPGRRRHSIWVRTDPLLRVAFTQLVRAYWLRGLAREAKSPSSPQPSHATTTTT